jgi:hypothetical protein
MEYFRCNGSPTGCLQKTYCHIHQVFHTQDEAEDWLGDDDDDNEGPDLVPRKHQGDARDSDDNSSVPDVDVKGIAKANCRKKKNQARRVKKRKEAKEKKKEKAKAKKPRKSDKRAHNHSCSSKKQRGKSDD